MYTGYCTKADGICASTNYFFGLTEVTGDVIRNIDLPITPLAPHTASASAGVCVFLCFTVNGDISINEYWIIFRVDWNTSTAICKSKNRLNCFNGRISQKCLTVNSQWKSKFNAAAHTHSDYCWLSPEVQTQRAPPSSLLNDINISLWIKIHQSHYCPY